MKVASKRPPQKAKGVQLDSRHVKRKLHPLPLSVIVVALVLRNSMARTVSIPFDVTKGRSTRIILVSIVADSALTNLSGRVILISMKMCNTYNPKERRRKRYRRRDREIDIANRLEHCRHKERIFG